MTHKPLAISIKLDGTGAGTGFIQNNVSGALWTVDQIGFGPSLPPVSGCSVSVYYNVTLVDTNYFAGTGGSMSGPPPVEMQQSDILKFVVSNGPANGSIPVNVSYVETFGRR